MCSGALQRNSVSLERPTYDFMAKALRAIKFVSNQLPRAVCNLGDNEGQVERQASAIGVQRLLRPWRIRANGCVGNV
jgi:hypothetical protein